MKVQVSQVSKDVPHLSIDFISHVASLVESFLCDADSVGCDALVGIETALPRSGKVSSEEFIQNEGAGRSLQEDVDSGVSGWLSIFLDDLSQEVGIELGLKT